MASRYLILIAFSIAGSCAGSQNEVDSYMDRIVGYNLRAPVASMNLDPVRLPWYQLSLGRSSLLGKHVSVVMDHGSLHGLSGVLQRKGDCRLLHPIGQNVTITCDATFDGLRARFRVFVQHDTLPFSIVGQVERLMGLSSSERLEMEFTVKDSLAVFEITAFPDRRCSLKLFHVSAMEMEVTQDNDPKLGENMKTQFEKAVKLRVGDTIKEILQYQFKDALDEASRRGFMSVD